MPGAGHFSIGHAGGGGASAQVEHGLSGAFSTPFHDRTESASRASQDSGRTRPNGVVGRSYAAIGAGGGKKDGPTWTGKGVKRLRGVGAVGRPPSITNFSRGGGGVGVETVACGRVLERKSRSNFWSLAGFGFNDSSRNFTSKIKASRIEWLKRTAAGDGRLRLRRRGLGRSEPTHTKQTRARADFWLWGRWKRRRKKDPWISRAQGNFPLLA